MLRSSVDEDNDTVFVKIKNLRHAMEECKHHISLAQICRFIKVRLSLSCIRDNWFSAVDIFICNQVKPMAAIFKVGLHPSSFKAYG